MTHKEAKGNIWREHCCEQCDEKSCESCTYNKAILALEKQIPQKPTFIMTSFSEELGEIKHGHCPVCNRMRLSFDKFCGECGQALDWSVSE